MPSTSTKKRRLSSARVDDVVAAGHEREEREAAKRAKLQEGAFSYDLDNLREVVEQGGR